MAGITFDVTLFRAQFPAFADNTAYPDVLLQQYFDSATDYVSTSRYGYLTYNQRRDALYLMTAHLAQIYTNIKNGNSAPTVTTGATIDKVSVTLEPPPVKKMFQWWLAQTQYGAQLLTLLQMNAAGGWWTCSPFSGGILGFRR